MRKSCLMTVAQLADTDEFRKLSVKQAMFVETYVQGFIDTGKFERDLATSFGYPNASDKHRRTLGYAFLRMKKIQAVLQLWRRISLELLDEAIEKSRPQSERHSLLLNESKLISTTLRRKPKKERPMYKPWNRSSNFSPEQIGALNTAICSAVEKAIEYFDATPAAKSLNSEAQRKEAYSRIANGVTDKISEFAEAFKQ